MNIESEATNRFATPTDLKDILQWIGGSSYGGLVVGLGCKMKFDLLSIKS
jgi:hypothetical protein